MPSTSDTYPPPSKSDLKVPVEVRRGWEQYGTERDRLRAEIRARVSYRLGKLTGIPAASMHWTDKEFLFYVVQMYGCGLFGWPADLPFQNLCYMEGGVVPLRRLLKAWKKGELRLVKLNDADSLKAINDPKSFLPNPALRPAKKPRLEAVPNIPQHVLHPYDFHIISGPSAATSSSSPLDTAPNCARRQRADTKRPHRRELRYKRGVQTPAHVYEAPVNFARFDMSSVAFSEYPV